MGRGRAKAKQQKVARELKYNTHFTDLDALQRELGTSSSGADVSQRGGDGVGTVDGVDGADPDVEDDEYSPYAVDEYEGWTGTDR
jgi:hypothetical protein